MGRVLHGGWHEKKEVKSQKSQLCSLIRVERKTRNYLNRNIKETIMTQDRLSIVDIFKIGELFEEISRALSYSINPLHSL